MSQDNMPPAPQPAPAGQGLPGQQGLFDINAILAAAADGSIVGAGSGEPSVFVETREEVKRIRGTGRKVTIRSTQTLGLSAWTRRWYELAADERADYSERFRQAGFSVSTPLQAYEAWKKIGQMAADQYAGGSGQAVSPDELLDVLIADNPNADDEGEADLGPVEERKFRVTARTQLEQFAYQNGLQISKQAMRRHVDDLIGERTSMTDLQKLYMNQLAAAYPAFSDQIAAGMSLRDIANPYISEMSQMLELPEDAIDFKDPALSKALQAVGNDGKPTYIPLWQFREQLKQDERWQYTDQAWQEAGAMAEGIARMFGFRA